MYVTRHRSPIKSPDIPLPVLAVVVEDPTEIVSLISLTGLVKLRLRSWWSCSIESLNRKLSLEVTCQRVLWNDVMECEICHVYSGSKTFELCIATCSCMEGGNSYNISIQTLYNDSLTCMLCIVSIVH